MSRYEPPIWKSNHIGFCEFPTYDNESEDSFIIVNVAHIVSIEKQDGYTTVRTVDGHDFPVSLEYKECVELMLRGYR